MQIVRKELFLEAWKVKTIQYCTSNRGKNKFLEDFFFSILTTFRFSLWPTDRLLIPPGACCVFLCVLDPECMRGAVWAWRGRPHMWTGQELLHDVAVINLPTAGQPLLLRVQLLVLLNLKQTHKVILYDATIDAKRFLGGLNLNERDYRPNLSPIPWCCLIQYTQDILDLLLRRTWAVARPRQSHSCKSPWTVGSLEGAQTRERVRRNNLY